MANYTTPDVYVEEISTLPPSIAQVSTAVPAFLGYTAVGDRNGSSLKSVPVRINTLLEYKSIFGGPDQINFAVTVDGQKNIQSIIQDANDKQHRLYYALDHFFKNGGSTCYIVSTGTYATGKAKADFLDGLAALEKEDEPTLLLLSEASTLDPDDYYEICQQALQQCEKLGDRFCLFDVLATDQGAEADAGNFRNGIALQNLKYGAAYYPYLNTSLNYLYQEEDISISGLPEAVAPGSPGTPASPANRSYSLELGGIRLGFTGADANQPMAEVVAGAAKSAVAITLAGNTLTISNVGAGGKAGSLIAEAWSAVADKGNFTLVATGDGSQAVTPTAATPLAAAGGPPPGTATASGKTLRDLQQSQTVLYNQIKLELNKIRLTLPPAPAVAGVYASVDRERGVWKAPANVSLNAVLGPTSKISQSDQDRLNVDENGGKSINAIRSFFGKGTLVWGARTLAGNDNEWRYVPVRRLFIMIEESAKKASYFAVFEPNNAATWIKVKGMIESYLYGLWQQGALAGSTPKAAYYVNIGLGTTMTQQDILEGRMIIEIGLAAVRPAEFIILRFSHKLQEA
jgi:phage tail sheath protein FI